MWVNFDPPLAVRIHFQKLLVWVITGKALVALFLLNFIITVWKNPKSQRVRAESSPLALHSSATISASIYSVAALPAIVCQEKPDLLALLWSPNSLVQPETPRRCRKLTRHNRARMHANTLSSPGWVPLTATQITERGSCSANKELSQVDKNWCLTTQESQRRPAILHQERFCVLEVFPNWGELLALDAANKRCRQTPCRKRFIAAPHQLQAANSADYRFRLQAPLGIPALRVSSSTDSFLSPTPKSGSQETIRTS